MEAAALTEREQMKERYAEVIPLERHIEQGRNLFIGEIMDAMREHKLSEFHDDVWEFADEVAAILCDAEDDKLGRLNDLHYATCMKVAEWIADNPKGMYERMALKKLGMA
jgi:hypothetical protein